VKIPEDPAVKGMPDYTHLKNMHTHTHTQTMKKLMFY